MDRLQSIRVFAGAGMLELSPSAVARLVRDLEDYLGVQLLQRSTCRLALTFNGEAYLDRLRGILSDIDDAEEAVHSPAREMSGSVRVASRCNGHEAVLRSTVEGAGISSQVLQVAAPLLRTGRLQRVLTPWLAERFTLLACFASRRYVPTRTRAFLDHLIRHATLAKDGVLPGGHL